MVNNLLLALPLLFSFVTAEIVYARTNRLDQAEFDQWNKTCGIASDGNKVAFKVMVHVETKSGQTNKCVGVIMNKRFVATSATCYYDRTKNDFNDDSDMRVATFPSNTKIYVCADDGVNCAGGERTVVNILYPQLIHYSLDNENVADIALLETENEFTDGQSICVPPDEELFTNQRVFLLSDQITDKPYVEGEFEWNGERLCVDGTTCTNKYTFKPLSTMTNKPSRGLFYVRKNDRLYILGFLKYEGDSPKISVFFTAFGDFICTNTGSCEKYDIYHYEREVRVIVNGLPLPQVSHHDVRWTQTRYDPLFFRFLPSTEMDYVRAECGKELAVPEGETKTIWHEFPYMAAIIGPKRICSGAFISRVHVITVAHCIFTEEEFRNIRNRNPLNKEKYIEEEKYEVRYGSECYADGLPMHKLDKCEGNKGKGMKISKVRSMIVDGLKKDADDWMYKYHVVLMELEQPAPKETVIPICIHRAQVKRDTILVSNSEDSFDFTSVDDTSRGRNTFIAATGNKLDSTICTEFRNPEHNNRVGDYNCRDDNINLVPLGTNDAQGLSKSSLSFLGSQLTVYTASDKRRELFALAPYFSHNPHADEKMRLGAFYPINKNERFICWFTGVCHERPETDEDRSYKIYTPNYRLTVSVLDEPVQRAGKYYNFSNYDALTYQDRDFDW